MTVNEALELLLNAPCSNKPSKVNPALTELQVLEIMTTGLEESLLPNGHLRPAIEKRIYQVARNQKRPRY